MLAEDRPTARTYVSPHVESVLVEKARRIQGQRQLRDEVLGGDLFGDPGWDLMLDVYIAQASGDRISVTGAAVGSGRALSTGLRWLKLLVERGLVVRDADPYDGRRSYLRLTQTAFAAMENFLGRC